MNLEVAVEKKAVLMVACIAVSGCAGLRHEQAAPFGSLAGDLITTEMVLAQGGEELNPLGKTRAGRLAVGIGSAFLLDRMRQHWEGSGSHRLAWLAWILPSMTHGLATAWNIGQMGGAR